MIDIQLYDATYKNQWNDLIARSDNGHFMFSRDFMEYHADKFQDCSFIVKRNDIVIGAIPGNITQDNWYSHQGLTFGGVLLDPKYNRILLTDSILKQLILKLRELHVRTIIYKFVPHIYHKRPCHSDLYLLSKYIRSQDTIEVSSTIDLYNPNKFSQLRIRGTKKSNQQRLEYAQSESWSDFWKILAERLEDKYHRKPVHSLAEIVSLQAKFQNNIKLFTAVKEQNVCAGVVIFETDTVAHCQYIAANDFGTNINALDGLFNFLIKYYTNLGKRYFNFGISTENAGKILNENLIQFKEGFGAQSIVHVTYEFVIADQEIL